MPTIGAGNGVRTRDTKLGKLVLYQLSYARLKFYVSTKYSITLIFSSQEIFKSTINGMNGQRTSSNLLILQTS